MSERFEVLFDNGSSGGSFEVSPPRRAAPKRTKSLMPKPRLSSAANPPVRRRRATISDKENSDTAGNRFAAVKRSAASNAGARTRMKSLASSNAKKVSVAKRRTSNVNEKLLLLTKATDSNRERISGIHAEIASLKKTTDEMEQQLKLSNDKRGALEVKKDIREMKSLNEADTFAKRKEMSKQKAARDLLEKEMSDLTAQLDAAQGDLEKKKLELEATQTTMEASLQEAEQQLQEARAAMGEEMENYIQKSAESNQLQETYADLLRNRNDQKSKLETAIAQLVPQIKQKKALVKRLNEEQDRLNQKLPQITENVEQLEVSVSEVDEQLAILREARDEKASLWEEDSRAFLEQIQILSSGVAEIEDENKSLVSSLSAVLKEHKLKDFKADEAIATLDRNQAALDKLRALIKELRKERSEMEQKQVDQGVILHGITNQIVSLKEEAEITQGDREKLVNEFINIQAHAEELSDSVESIHKEYELEVDARTAFEEETLAIKISIENEQPQFESYRLNISQLQEAYEEAHQEILDIQAQAAAVIEDEETALADGELASESLQQEKQTLTADLEQFKADLEAKAKELCMATAAFVKLSADFNNLTSELEEMEVAHETHMNEAHNALEDEIAEAENQIKDVRSQVNALDQAHLVQNLRSETQSLKISELQGKITNVSTKYEEKIANTKSQIEVMEREFSQKHAASTAVILQLKEQYESLLESEDGVEGEVKVMEAKLHAATDEQAELHEQIGTAKSEVTHSHEVLEGKEAAFSQYSRQKATQQQQIANLREKIEFAQEAQREQEEKFELLQSRRDQINSQLHDLLEKEAEAQETLTSLQAEKDSNETDNAEALEAKKQNRVQLAQHLDESYANLSSLRSSLTAANTTLASLRSSSQDQLRNLSAAIFKESEKIFSIRSALSTEKVEKANVEAALAGTSSNVERLQTEEQSLNLQIATLQEDIRRDVEASATLRVRLGEEKSTANELRKHCESVRDNLDSVVASLAKANEDESVARQKIVMLSERESTSEGDLQKFEQRVMNLQKATASLTEQQESLAVEYEGLQRDYDALCTAAKETEEENDKLRAEREERTATEHKLQASLKDLLTNFNEVVNFQQQNIEKRDDLRNDIDEVEEKIQNTEADLEEARNSLTETQENWDTTRALVEEAREEAAELQESVNSLNESLKETQDDIESTSSILSTTGSEVAEVSAAINELKDKFSALKESLLTSSLALATTHVAEEEHDNDLALTDMALAELDSEYAELQRQLEETRAQLQLAEMEKKESYIEAAASENALSATTTRHLSNLTTVDAFQSVKEQLAESMVRAQEQFNSESEALEESKAAYAELQAQNEEQLAAFLARNSALEKLEMQQNAFDGIIAHDEEEIATVDQEIENVDFDLASLRQQLAQSLKMLETNSSALESAQSQLAAKGERVKDFEGYAEKSERTRITLNENIIAATQKAGELESNIHSMESEISTVREEKERLSSTLAGIRKANVSFEQEFSTLKFKVDLKEQQIEKLESLYLQYSEKEEAAREKVNEQIEAAVKELKAEFLAKEAAFEAIKAPFSARMEEKEERLSVSISEMSRAQSQVAEYKEIHRKEVEEKMKEMDIDSIHVNLTLLQLEYHNNLTERELARCKTITRLRDKRIEELRSAIERLRGVEEGNAILRETMEARDGQIREMEDKLATLQEKLDHIEAVTARAEDALTSAHVKDSAIESLKEKIQELNTANDDIDITYTSLLEEVGALIFAEGKGSHMYIKARKDNMELTKEKITLEAQLNFRRSISTNH